MYKIISIIATLTFSIIACQSNNNINMTDLQQEFYKTELDFAKMADEKGVETAFLYFAADSAVLLRENNLIKGKDEMKNYFSKSKYKKVKLKWKPDFVDVANSGDLAYTYGKYTFSGINEDGDTINSEGIFHTVWKRQEEGNWKFVWD